MWYLVVLKLNPSPDVNDRMPRDEAKALFELIKPIGTLAAGAWLISITYSRTTALSLDPKLNVEIMGSYRRYIGGSLLPLS